jgi:hypothetical protein
MIDSGELKFEQRTSSSINGDVMLAIGEQIERLVEAADQGEGETFIALAERLRQTADRYEIDRIGQAASRAIAIVNEDAQLENLVKQSFELLAVCRELRAGLSVPA